MNQMSRPQPHSDAARRAGAVLSVDLDAIAANYRLLADRGAAGSGCAAVVKADAYGLGKLQVAPVLYGAGCRVFFVALPDEGLRLRGLLPPDAEVHVLGGLAGETASDFAGEGLIPTLNALDEIAAWAAAARQLARALPAVLHVDTGMRRFGLPPDELAHLSRHPEALAGLDLKLIISHLIAGEEPDNPANPAQLAGFRDALGRLPRTAASLANSSGIFLGPDYHFDLLRPGVALYGANPTPGRRNPMRPVVRLDGRIWQLRKAAPGETVGYGATHRLSRPTRLATVALGYGDGLPRSLSNKGRVFVAGRPAPIVGRISMDSLTVDVTDLPDGLAAAGGLVEVIGPNSPLDEVAEAAGTVAYELLTGLGRRYHRDYLGGSAASA